MWETLPASPTSHSECEALGDSIAKLVRVQGLALTLVILCGTPKCIPQLFFLALLEEALVTKPFLAVEQS